MEMLPNYGLFFSSFYPVFKEHSLGKAAAGMGHLCQNSLNFTSRPDSPKATQNPTQTHARLPEDPGLRSIQCDHHALSAVWKR